MTTLGDRKLVIPEVLDEGAVVAPFCFQINGTSNPDNAQGAIIQGRAVTRAGAGKFTFVVANQGYAVLGGACVISAGGDTEDIYPQADYSTANTSGGTITIRTKTGTNNTDPADNDWVFGVIFLTKTDRRTGA